MLQVVILTGDSPYALENSINIWLDNHRAYEVAGINYAGKGFAGGVYSAMIAYR